MRLHTFLIEHCVYPMMEAARGNQIRKKLAFLTASDSAAPEQLASRQQTLVSELLTHCSEHVPAYENSGLSEGEIRQNPIASLRKIPPLTKKVFRENTGKYLAQNLSAAERIPNTTSGSTGMPLRFFISRDQVEWYEAARWRGLGWYGITPGSRSIIIWGGVQTHAGDSNRRLAFQAKEYLLKNRRVLSAFTLSEKDAARYVRLLNRYRPEYLYGYCSALAEFARIIRPYKQQLRVQLKAVVPTSELLHPEQEALFQEVFSCPVANEYGARDAGILAYRCPCGNFHITEENALLEVLDPATLEPVPDGQSGLLAVTDLHNVIQPRLRYLLGDFGARSTKPCPCGRRSALLEHLDGREDAMLVRKNGELVNGNVVAQIARENPAIVQHRFVQHSMERATFFVVKAEGTLDADKQLRALREVLPGVEITMQIVPEIPPRASGKICSVVREFPIPQRDKP